jgi:flavin-dependent dehydrogenase
LLARAGWSVALVERKAFPRPKVCGEYLSATSLPLLDRLGIGEQFRGRAGPAVRRVGLFAGDVKLAAPLPASAGEWGRALGREHLDTLLGDRARAAGAVVFQPATVTELIRRDWGFVCRGNDFGEIESRVVIAAHGYWETGPLPTQPPPSPARPGDLLGFKAHLTNTGLPDDLMPLLAFTGGYGGMVHTDNGRVSLSCCIRRDRLSALRTDHGGERAGEAVFNHILNCCRGIRDVLRDATKEGRWLATGPIRPGIRVRREGGLFRVGNAAGEAHPVIAEGISMAMQSGWLLTRRLVARGVNRSDWDAVAVEYARAWRRVFGPRIRAAALFAHWAMRPAAVATTLPLLRAFPGILGLGARLSGKATSVVN